MITEDEIDELGTMLEDKGMSHSDIDSYFLEHHGVKGMRWGIRNKISRSINRDHVYSNNKRAKRTIIIGGVAAGLIGAKFVASRTLNVPLSAIAGVGSAYVGARAVSKILDTKGDEKISSLFDKK